MHRATLIFCVRLCGLRLMRGRCLTLKGILGLAVGFFGGCQQQPAQPLDSSQVVVTPGVGISNRYEVGMSYSRIRESFPDAVASRGAWGKHSKSMLVPSLGAMSYLGNDMPVSHITFYLEPSEAALYPELEVRTPFRGWLGDKFNFGERSVSGQDVEAVYGPVLKRILVAGDGLRLLQQANPYSRSNRVNEETWWYPALGVSFGIKSNRVTSFEVFRPTATNAPNLMPIP